MCKEPRPDAKSLLGQALKSLLEHKDLDRVTVTDIARTAGVTRQAFYYHFDDVRDCAIWVFETEISDHIYRHASYEAWAQGFDRLLAYLFEHRLQTKAVLASLELDRAERFFFRSLRVMMTAVVDDLDPHESLHDTDRTFLIDHYTLAVVGHLVHWLAQGMKDDPETLVGNIEFIMRGHVAESIARMNARRNNAG